MYQHGVRIICLLLCLFGLSALAQNNAMTQGINAFNEGNYEQALAFFQAVEAEGNTSASLQYNLAVTLYRLGRYDQARNRFMPLADDPEWEALVLYNFGLIADAMGDRDEAVDYFSRAARQQREPKIQAAAQRKLDAFRAEAADRRVSRDDASERTPGVSLVSVAVGSDSNASTLSDEFVQHSSAREDVFTELLGYTQGYLSGRRRDGIRLYGLLFNRRFRDFDNLDSLVYGGGLVWEKPVAGFDLESELRLVSTRLDGEKVADEARLKLGAGKQLSIGRLESEFFFSRFSAGDGFEQVEGSRQRLDLSWQKSFTDLTWAARYRYETNNRDDLSRPNGAYSSYSPTRNRLLGELDWQFAEHWSAGLSYEYIDDEYDGINRLRDADGTVREQQRERRIDQFQAELVWRPARSWQLSLNAENTEADDVYALYTYDKQRYLLKFEYRFQ